MLGNTITLTYNGAPLALTKATNDKFSSIYIRKEVTQQFRLTIRHSMTGAKASIPLQDRHNVELVRSVYATPTAAAFEQKAYFVFELSKSDLDPDLQIALSEWGAVEANVLSLIGWES